MQTYCSRPSSLKAVDGPTCALLKSSLTAPFPNCKPYCALGTTDSILSNVRLKGTNLENQFHYFTQMFWRGRPYVNLQWFGFQLSERFECTRFSLESAEFNTPYNTTSTLVHSFKMMNTQTRPKVSVAVLSGCSYWLPSLFHRVIQHRIERDNTCRNRQQDIVV